MREYLPDLNHLTDREKDALMVELWEEIQQLRARVKGEGSAQGLNRMEGGKGLGSGHAKSIEWPRR